MSESEELFKEGLHIFCARPVGDGRNYVDPAVITRVENGVAYLRHFDGSEFEVPTSDRKLCFTQEECFRVCGVLNEKWHEKKMQNRLEEYNKSASKERKNEAS